jgi:integrase
MVWPMVKSTSSRGRPKAIYFPKLGGDPVVGLMRLGDGRWRASGPEKYTFTEPDEKLAIVHFREWEARQLGSNLGTLKVHGTAYDAMWDMAKRALDSGGSLSATVERGPEGSKTWAVVDDNLSPAQWAWLRRQIIKRPKWVAERVGIEKIGYLRDVQEPELVPKLEALKRIWDEHFKSSVEQRRKCPVAFEDFRRVAGIKSIEEIKPDLVVKYRDAVYARNLTGKGQSNLFTRVRRYLSFFRDRAIAIDTIKRALGYLTLLTPNQTTVTLDPQPIEVGDWKKLLAKADGDDKAMILLMLNCAMYAAEVVRLRWEDLRNGCLVTHRAKTGKCVRVAVLWKETLDALAKIQRHGPFVFVNYAGAPLAIKGAEKRFRDLRDEAKLPHVTSSMLRDGAYTAAVEANVTSNLCQLLVGHRSGLQDNYVKRRPAMVAPACDAIRKAYRIRNGCAAAQPV